MGRSPCCDKTKVKRGPWSQEEDAILRSFVQRFGNAGNWIALPQKAGLRRCGKSCRLRWLNYLRPELRHGGFTDDEDNLILSLYAELGSKWSVIASRLPGRTDNDVKNYWNTKLKKRYLASTGESETRTVAPLAPATSTEDSSTAADDSAATTASDDHRSKDDEPPPPALANNLDAGADDDELARKSEQLYAELMGIITTAADHNPPPSTGREEAASSSSSSSSGTSPTVSSSSGSYDGGVWAAPTADVHGATLLSESGIGSSGMFDAACYGFFDDAFGAPAALLPEHSFQDLLAASYDDVTAAATTTQELLYY